jgi:hypothetical protein
MPDDDVLSILLRISYAFPDKPLDESTLKVYMDELADIPILLLERAARQLIRTSSFFPRISELRQAADQIAGITFDSPASSLGASYLNLEARLLETDYFQHGEFDMNKWEKLVNQLNQVNRPYRAAEVREKASHIQEREAAFLRGEDFPSAEARQRYAQWDPNP